MAALGKAAQLPFSSWLSRAMDGPSPVSALLHSAAMVAMGGYLLLRTAPLLAASGWAGTTAAWAGALTALLLGAVAVAQRDLKQLLAASTAAQLGFVVLAAGLSAVAAGSAHLLAHAATKALLFLAAGAWLSALGTRQLSSLGGVGRRWPAVGVSATVGLLALAGVAPLSLWATKDEVLAAALRSSPALYLVGPRRRRPVGRLRGQGAARPVWRADAGRRRAGVRPRGAGHQARRSGRDGPARRARRRGGAARGAGPAPGGRRGPRSRSEGRLRPGRGAGRARGLRRAARSPCWPPRRGGGVPEPALLRDWLYLPRLVDAVVVRPVLRLSGAWPGSTTGSCTGRWTWPPAGSWPRRPRRRPSTTATSTAPCVPSPAARGRRPPWPARADDRVVDGTVRLLVRQVRRLGGLARRPQTGQLHQYYLQLAAALAAGLLLLLLVR